MSQMFSSDGGVVPVTLVSAEPNEIMLRRDEKKDGYTAVQLQHNDVRREFKIDVDGKTSHLTVEQFEPGDVVEVSGVSKGKGYAGVVKRHGFAGGPASHGHRHALRKSGSIGSAFPQHVLKGKKMAGRMGSDKVTVKNLTVVWTDKEKHLLAIKGAVPGRRGAILEITGN